MEVIFLTYNVRAPRFWLCYLKARNSIIDLFYQLRLDIIAWPKVSWLRLKDKLWTRKTSKQLMQFLPRKESACSTREGKIHVCPLHKKVCSWCHCRKSIRQKSYGGVGKQAVCKDPCPKGKYLCTFENMLPLIPTWKNAKWDISEILLSAHQVGSCCGRAVSGPWPRALWEGGEGVKRRGLVGGW